MFYNYKVQICTDRSATLNQVGAGRGRTALIFSAGAARVSAAAATRFSAETVLVSSDRF